MNNKGSKIITTDAQMHILRTMDQQNAKGLNKYGEYLKTFNGLDSISYMWEEIGDLINYAEALSQEYIRMREMLLELHYEVPAAKKYMLEHFAQEELEFIIPT